MRLWRLFFFALILLCSDVLSSSAQRVDSIQVKSIRQETIGQGRSLFTGNVEIWIDRRVHVWADSVLFDQKNMRLYARGFDHDVICEDNDFLVLADDLILDLHKKTGSASRMRIHVNDGYITALCAQKKDGPTWEMSNVSYTACDGVGQHWSLKARSACVYGGYLLKIRDLSLNVGSVPILWLPMLAVPLQRQSHSGFLPPHFSYDYHYGIGLKQEYYCCISPHADLSFAVDWRDRRGLLFLNDFRWARSPTDYTVFKGYYGKIHGMLSQHGGVIDRRTLYRYWLCGDDIHAASIDDAGTILARLVHIDIGTDKRVGYHFFNSLDEVENCFNNLACWRVINGAGVHSVKFDAQTTKRKEFFNCQKTSCNLPEVLVDENDSIKRELAHNLTVLHVPHVEYNRGYQNIFPSLCYRYDFFIDQALFRQKERERFFNNNILICEKSVQPLKRGETIRAEWRGSLLGNYQVPGGNAVAWLKPIIQFRSHIRQKEASSINKFPAVVERELFTGSRGRLLWGAGVEYALRPCEYSLGGIDWSTQCSVQGEYIPRFLQEHWHYMDSWDRMYPAKRLTILLNNTALWQDYTLTWDIACGYDGYDAKDRFFLERANDQHVLPCVMDWYIQNDRFTLSIHQEYDVPILTLTSSNVCFSFTHKKWNWSCGYLYQEKEMQQKRLILSPMAHAWSVACSVPITKKVTLNYDGQFQVYGDGRRHVSPLIQRVGLRYKGHCWGIFLGFEEKRYQEYGICKTDRLVVFSIRLDTLGSFAKKMRNFM